MSDDFDIRPWGSYLVLNDKPDHKVKRIVVSPGKRLSLQKHRHRQEHWYFVSGEGAVVLDDQEIKVSKGSSVDIPLGSVHRACNTSAAEPLVFIEVQTGEYFGEDDIERIQDDFNRK